jgi:hypothetical protein
MDDADLAGITLAEIEQILDSGKLHMDDADMDDADLAGIALAEIEQILDAGKLHMDDADLAGITFEEIKQILDAGELTFNLNDLSELAIREKDKEIADKAIASFARQDIQSWFPHLIFELLNNPNHKNKIKLLSYIIPPTGATYVQPCNKGTRTTTCLVAESVDKVINVALLDPKLDAVTWNMLKHKNSTVFSFVYNNPQISMIVTTRNNEEVIDYLVLYHPTSTNRTSKHGRIAARVLLENVWPLLSPQEKLQYILYTGSFLVKDTSTQDRLRGILQETTTIEQQHYLEGRSHDDYNVQMNVEASSGNKYVVDFARKTRLIHISLPPTAQDQPS